MRDRKLDRQETDNADFVEYRIGRHYTNSQQQNQYVTDAGKDDTTRKYADKITQTPEQ